MDSSEKVKLYLLSQSKNMVNAANSGDWDRYNELEGAWKEVLSEASEAHKDMFNNIIPLLLEDVAEIQNAIKLSQQAIYKDVKDLIQRNRSIKRYLE